MKKVNVIAFPGTNCQVETARAIRKAGFESTILRWNSPPEEVYESDALVIAGGFSFEDRGRSGVIAAADPIAETLKKMAAAGKPLLGICNGAQILVEIGLVPGFHAGKTELSLSRNRREAKEGILGSGYFHDFVNIKPHGMKCAWTHFEDILRLPIAHAEGRFLSTPEITAEIEQAGLSSLKYCDADGKIDPHFPVNPNGSVNNWAAVCNPQGNVMAMMPHPERVQEGQKIFQSLHTHFQAQAKPVRTIEPTFDSPVTKIEAGEEYPIEIFVQLKITDNTEKTLESTLRRKLNDSDISLSRMQYWGIETDENTTEIAKRVIDSEEFFNENKETALFRIEGRWFTLQNGKLIEFSGIAPKNFFLSLENDDILGEEKKVILSRHSGLKAEIHSGVAWSLSKQIANDVIAKTNLFGNPISWTLVAR